MKKHDCPELRKANEKIKWFETWTEGLEKTIQDLRDALTKEKVACDYLRVDRDALKKDIAYRTQRFVDWQKEQAEVKPKMTPKWLRDMAILSILLVGACIWHHFLYSKPKPVQEAKEGWYEMQTHYTPKAKGPNLRIDGNVPVRFDICMPVEDYRASVNWDKKMYATMRSRGTEIANLKEANRLLKQRLGE